MPVKDLKDFTRLIAQTLDFKEQAIPEWFSIEETKDGYFTAVLQKGKWLDNLPFKALCGLMRDLKGDYVKGAQTFSAPGPMAKKEPSGIAPNDVKDDKRKPDLPNIRFVSVNAIHVPSFLPTRELIDLKQGKIRESIKKHGLKYPIRVRPGTEPETYELIDGFLRLQSVKQLGWTEIITEIKDTSDQEVVIESIIMNKDRIEEDPITIAKKLDILVNAFGYTQEKLAQELGISQPEISHYVGLLRLPKEIQHYVALNNVSFYHGLLLLTLEKPELQVQLAKEVIDKGLSTRQLEERIQEVQPKPGVPPPIGTVKPQDVTYGKAKEILDTPAGREVLIDAVKEAVAKGEIPASMEDEEFRIFAEGIATVEDEHEPLEPSEKAGVGSSETVHRHKLEGVQVGEFHCTECNQHFVIDHISADKHRLKKVEGVPE